MWEADRRGWETPAGAPVPFITAGFDVRFLRPTPLGPPVRLVASPERIDESEIVVRSELAFDDKVRATMSATWKRFRPR
jgi:acyl-coenzyme A thioesterase PaaI-like protein